MLIVRSHQFQFCDALVGAWVLVLATDKQFLCLMGDRGIGKHGRRHPDAWRYQVGFRHVIAGGTVVAVPDSNFLMTESVLVINSAYR